MLSSCTSSTRQRPMEVGRVSDYTPTTKEVRQQVYRDMGMTGGEQFDRWLAAHDAEVRENAVKAVQDAFLAMRLEFDGLLRRLFLCISDAARGGSHE